MGECIEADPSMLSSQIGEEVYHVTGEVEMEGGASFLHCSVNGVKSRPKLVILDNTVHLFSTVCSSHFSPQCRDTKMMAEICGEFVLIKW